MGLSNRDTFVRYIDPLETLWEDKDGMVHFSVVNAMRVFRIPDTPENRAKTVTVWQAMMLKVNPDAVIVERDEPDSIDYYLQKPRDPLS